MFDYKDMTSRVVAGAAAGNITVTGIALYDQIILVQDLTTGLNLRSEFTVSADNTINNTGGTSTNGHATIVVWQKKYGGGRSKYSSLTAEFKGRATS